METMTDSFLLLLITVTTKCFYLTFSCNFIEYYVCFWTRRFFCKFYAKFCLHGSDDSLATLLFLKSERSEKNTLECLVEFGRALFCTAFRRLTSPCSPTLPSILEATPTLAAILLWQIDQSQRGFTHFLLSELVNL